MIRSERATARDLRILRWRMSRCVDRVLTVLALVLLWPGAAIGQSFRVGVIDFYGLRGVTVSQARDALTIREGDTLAMGGDAMPAAVTQAEGRLAALPGVVSARLNVVCCETSGAILYVGLVEKGASTLRFRALPRGSVRLPTDVLAAGQAYDSALMQAIQAGDAREDDSQGHALGYAPALRAIQERFIVFAARDMTVLRDVLRHAASAEHRAIAAQVLAYAANKREVVDDLAQAMDDASEEVRNNAMRSLAVMAPWALRTPALRVRIPAAPFVRLLSSPVWTDRNKSSMALMALSATREPSLMASMRKGALASLVDMARWKSEGHATPGLMLLGRIGGMPEDAIQAAVSRGDRETAIAAALKGR
jgi:hypothetical protein